MILKNRATTNAKPIAMQSDSQSSTLVTQWAELDLMVKQALWLSGEHHKHFEAMTSKMNDILRFGEDNVAAIEEINAAIQALEEMTKQTETIAYGLNSSAEAWQSEFNTTKNLFAHIQQLNEKMREANQDALGNNQNLQDAANTIDSITLYIRKIAKQTHLLALNASIEAARAGESGRGFAVVADEINKLSKETEQAIARIESIVSTFKHYVAVLNQSMYDTSKHASDVNDEVNASQSVFQAVEVILNTLTHNVIELEKQSAFQRETTQDIHAAISGMTTSITETHEHTLESLKITDALKEKNEALSAVYGTLEGLSINMRKGISPKAFDTKLVIGINPFTSPLRILDLYGPILKQIFNDHFVIYIPSSYSGIHEGLNNGLIDVAWLSPLAYIQTASSCKVSPLVSPKVSGKSSYTGYIISKHLTTLEGYSGAFAFVDESSASGYLYAQAHLKQLGAKFSPVFYGSHDRVIQAVLSGEVAAGATYNEALAFFDGNTTALRTLYQTPPIPKDCIVQNLNSHKSLSHLTEAFLAYQGQNIANITGFTAITDEAYDVVRHL